jgi:hypothetical protein
LTTQGFITRREVILSDPYDRYTLDMPALQRKYAYQLWPLERLKLYVDMLSEFGFNSLQLSDLAEDYACCGYAITQEEFGEKLHALSDYAKSKGMTRTLFVWGSGPVDVERSRGTMHDGSWENACPCVPGGSETLDKHYRRQARHAPWFDHVITHWTDPGGCYGGKCTLATACELHNRIVAEFRKHNGNIRSTYSLWLMHHREFGARWRGYDSVKSILYAGVLDEDVGLAQGGRFNLEEARAIARSGRTVGVWGWYLADDEIVPSIHVHTGFLGEYFNALPREASTLLSWHSVDSNCHGLNVPGLYVAAQLMMDPRRHAEAVLREFCGRAFGKAADGFAKGLLAVAHTRCHSDYLRLVKFLTGLPHKGSPDEEENPEQHLEIVRSARKVVDVLEVDHSFKPDFPLIIDAKTFLEELRVHLRVIEQYARFRIALAEAEKKRGKIDPAALPAVEPPGEFMSQFEYRLAQEHLGFLKK